MMLRNPIHLRFEKLKNWQSLTFMLCLCERMYPNYHKFCLETGFGDAKIYHGILDLLWETLLVKNVKVNFDHQLEKLEDLIPSAESDSIYGVYPAIDACIALSEVVHAHLSGETLDHTIAISEVSVRTVAMLAMTLVGKEMTEDELKMLPAVMEEWDIQWEIFRQLVDCKKPDLDLIKGLRSEIKAAAVSNIGINLMQLKKKRD